MTAHNRKDPLAALTAPSLRTRAGLAASVLKDLRADNPEQALLEEDTGSLLTGFNIIFPPYAVAAGAAR